MASLSALLFGVLAAVMFINVSADTQVTRIYTVTFASCGTVCPQGNPTNYNATFVLNSIISPNVTIYVNYTLQFNLATDVPNHPLTICQNSPIPNFCQGANGNNLLNTPITQSGASTSVTFNTTGTYYYGCLNHPGMGAIITVVLPDTSTSPSLTSSSVGTGSSSSSTRVTGSPSTTTKSTGDGHKLSASFLFIAVIPLLTMIFI